MQDRNLRKKRLFEMRVFTMMGTLMFCSKILMEFLPNIHLIGMLTMVYTLVFRTRALIPIYLYVVLNGVYAGFNMWWVPYLYIWTVLWGITTLLPRNMPHKVSAVVYPAVCALHGFAFGTLYAPAQAFMFGMSLKQMIAWIVAGFPWDVIHMVGNFVAGFLVLPLYKALSKLVKDKM